MIQLTLFRWLGRMRKLPEMALSERHGASLLAPTFTFFPRARSLFQHEFAVTHCIRRRSDVGTRIATKDLSSDKGDSDRQQDPCISSHRSGEGEMPVEAAGQDPIRIALVPWQWL